MQIDGICLSLGFSFPALYKSSLVRYGVIDEEVWKFTYLSKIWQWMFWVKWKSLTYHNLCIILTFCGRGNFGSQLGKSWTICKWLQDLLISNLIGQCHSKHKSNVYQPITFLEISQTARAAHMHGPARQGGMLGLHWVKKWPRVLIH